MSYYAERVFISGAIMVIRSVSRKAILGFGVVCVMASLAACTPRPSDRLLLSRGVGLKPGYAKALVLKVDPGRKELAQYLAQAFQACLIDRSPFFSGMVMSGPKQGAANSWTIALTDPQEQDRRGRDVLVTIGNPPTRTGIMRALPKDIPLGEATIIVKRVGAVNRTDSVIGVVADTLAGLSSCSGMTATGKVLVGTPSRPRVHLQYTIPPSP